MDGPKHTFWFAKVTEEAHKKWIFDMIDIYSYKDWPKLKSDAFE